MKYDKREQENFKQYWKQAREKVIKILYHFLISIFYYISECCTPDGGLLFLGEASFIISGVCLRVGDLGLLRDDPELLGGSRHGDS